MRNPLNRRRRLYAGCFMLVIGQTFGYAGQSPVTAGQEIGARTTRAVATGVIEGRVLDEAGRPKHQTRPMIAAAFDYIRCQQGRTSSPSRRRRASSRWPIPMCISAPTIPGRPPLVAWNRLWSAPKLKPL